VIDKTTESYNQTAVRYAARPFYPLEQELARFRHMMPAGGLTLDVGCGPGQYAGALISRGLRVTALDLSWGMLHQAQQNSLALLVQADMRRLPLADAAADGCFACASLLHLPRPRASLTLIEFRRVLCPGGALYVSVKEGMGEEWVTDREGHSRHFVYYDPEGIDTVIQAAGFELVDGWISPPGPGQAHNWINRFAVAR